MATAAFHASGEGEGKGRRHDIPSVDLLDRWGHIADDRNTTTATCKTSTGLNISVTFCTAGPQSFSHLSVDCPGLDLDHSNLLLALTVLATDADLVLLRVPMDPHARFDHSCSDYFVYRVHFERAKLDRLPRPCARVLGDTDIAILSCGDGRYVVAALEPRYDVARLHLCRSTPDGSTPDGKAWSWTWQRLIVEEPLRETVCPVPESARRTIFHSTTKTITLGGAKGTVGWVDLWRGILLCDVLEENPKLRDMPLPMPSKGNWSLFLNCCPNYSRDINVNQSRDTIKYIEMEFAMETSISDPQSYHEWLACGQYPQSNRFFPDNWKATIWSMPIPVTSWSDWKPQCSISSKHMCTIPADITIHDKLLHMFMSSSRRDDKGKFTGETLSLGRLHMAYPTLSIAIDDDDVVYLQSKGTGTAPFVFAVNLRAPALQGLVKPTTRYSGFMRWCLSTGISKHLKTTGLQIQENASQLEQGAQVLK